MPDSKQIPYLLKLLEDDSQKVRSEIARHLLAFGPRLKEELAKVPEKSIPFASREILTQLLENQERIRLRQRWMSWQQLEPEHLKLETALTFLAEFQSGLKYTWDLSVLLDELAEEYRRCHAENDVLKLAQFLFDDKNLRGVEQDYYHPQNSNLVYVILEKEGLPISLVCIYMLVGARLGLTIEGCNFPGHFMARVNHEGRGLLVDCYNAGKTIVESDVVALEVSADQLKKSALGTDAVAIVRRVLVNLVRAYELKEQSANQQCMLDLMAALAEKEVPADPKRS